MLEVLDKGEIWDLQVQQGQKEKLAILVLLDLPDKLVHLGRQDLEDQQVQEEKWDLEEIMDLQVKLGHLVKLDHPVHKDCLGQQDLKVIKGRLVAWVSQG